MSRTSAAPVIVSCAMAEEAQPFLDALPERAAAQAPTLPGAARTWSLQLPDGERELIVVRSGIGLVAAASALATVLAELVTNAVEHGLQDHDGTVVVTAQRDDDELTVHVIDDGVGLEPGAAMTGLGTRIVSTLVHGELRGTIDWRPVSDPVREARGTDVVVRARLAPSA